MRRPLSHLKGQSGLLKARDGDPGDPVIYRENDYEKELWNGSLGRADSVIDTPGKETLLCSFDGDNMQEISATSIRKIELAYAITVHKAQGSQFKKVIIPITNSRLLDRTLLCTALTRGIEQVVFVGDRSLF